MSVLRSVIGVHSRTSMRRHCLSSRRGGPALWCERQPFCPSRYASIRTSVSPLLCGSVHRMRSVFEIRLFGFYEKVLQSSERPSSWKVSQVHMAQSPNARDPKRVRATQLRGDDRLACATLGPSVLCQDHHLLFIHSLRSFTHWFSRPPGLHSNAGRCAVARRSLRSSTSCARAPRAFSLRPPQPVSLRSCLRGRLSSLHDVLDQSLSQKDLGCSGRCPPEASLASHLPPWRCVSGDLYLPTGHWLAQAPGMLLQSDSSRSGRDLPG